MVTLFVHDLVLFTYFIYLSIVLANRTAEIMRRRGLGSITVTALSSPEEFESEVVLKNFGDVTTCFQNGAGQ